MEKMRGMTRRNFVRVAGAAGAVVGSMAMLAGCGSQSSTSTASSATTSGTASTAGATSAAKAMSPRKEFNVALSAQPQAIDPLMTVANVTAEVANNIWESLYAMDDSYAPQPVLATTCDVSSDGLVYTFTLKQNVKFHDGTTMTAEDVVASMQRWVQLNSRAKTLFSDSTWAKVSDTQVSFTVTSAASDILITLASYQQFGGIMPKSIVEAATDTGVSEYIGTGPYKFEEWAQDQYILLTKFDDYHGGTGAASGFAGTRDAVAEELYFYIATDASTRVNALLTGQYDVIDSVPSTSYDSLKSNSEVQVLTNTGGYLCVYMNTTENSQLNQTLRQAVMYAIDNEAMLKTVYDSEELYSLDYNYMNPSMTQWQVEGGSEYYNKYNTERAKDLLEEGGYNGETIMLLTTGDYVQMQKGTEFVAEALRQIGVECQINSYEFAKYMEEKATFAGWDICVCTQSYQTTPAQLNVVNPSFNGLDDEQILDGIQAVRAAKTDDEAAEEWSKVQDRIYEYGAGYVVGHSLSITAIGAGVQGFDNFVVPVVYNAYVEE